MQIEQIEQNGQKVIKLVGSLDAAHAAQVEASLAKLVNQDQARVVLHLGGVDFIDSRGLATLVMAMKKARQQKGELYLCHLTPAVTELFELTALTKALSVFDTQEEALEAVGEAQK